MGAFAEFRNQVLPFLSGEEGDEGHGGIVVDVGVAGRIDGDHAVGVAQVPGVGAQDFQPRLQLPRLRQKRALTQEVDD